MLDVKTIAMASGMKSLRQSALIKMTQGLVSAEEVVSATMNDSDGSDSEQVAS